MTTNHINHLWRRSHNRIFPVGSFKYLHRDSLVLGTTTSTSTTLSSTILLSASTSTSSYLYRYLTYTLLPHPISSYLNHLVVVSCYVLVWLGGPVVVAPSLFPS